MKKGICILLSSALLMGTVPVYGDMAEVEQVTHTYRAEVGTKNFYEDDVLQTLDTEIYLKDGYVMLPVRTFFTAVDENAQILWDREKQVATVWMGEYRILLDVPKNKIQVEYGNVNVSGKLEVKDGRLFVPLRNWQKILTRCNYEMDENSIVWDSEKGEAIVNVGEHVINRDEELTKTEWRVIQKIGCGMSNKEIASELALSEGTVRNYLSSVLSKLELRDRTQLAIWAVQTGAVNRYIGE